MFLNACELTGSRVNTLIIELRTIRQRIISGKLFNICRLSVEGSSIHPYLMHNFVEIICVFYILSSHETVSRKNKIVSFAKFWPLNVKGNPGRLNRLEQSVQTRLPRSWYTSWRSSLCTPLLRIICSVVSKNKISTISTWNEPILLSCCYKTWSLK
jgi:hypothetical protein